MLIASGRGVEARPMEKGVCLCLICSEGLDLREMKKAQGSEKRFGESTLSKHSCPLIPRTSKRLWGKEQTGEAM